MMENGHPEEEGWNFKKRKKQTKVEERILGESFQLHFILS